MIKRLWIALAIQALLSTPTYAQSPLGSSLSNLAAGTTVTGADLFYDVQAAGLGGVKVTATQIQTFMSTNPIFIGTAKFSDGGTWGTAGITVTTLSIGSALTATSATFTNLTSTGANFTNLTSAFGAITTLLTAPFASSAQLTATNGWITNLTSTNANITNLTATTSAATSLLTSPFASFSQVTATNGWITNLTSTNGSITTLTGTNASFANLTATNGSVGTLTGTNASYFNLTSTNGSVATLTGTSANFATITFTTELVSAGGLPSVFACGTSPTGAVSATSTNQSGSLKTGGTTLTSCGIGFSAILPSAPKTCIIVAESTAAASDLTQTLVSAVTAGGWTLSATNTVNSATFGYICL